MNLFDDRGCRVSGASAAALAAYEQALAAVLSWRSGSDAPLAAALQEAPAFVMAHVLQAHLLVCSRDPRRVRSAQAHVARASGLPADERERLHLAALSAVLADDYQVARSRLDELLQQWPRDVLALQVAHAFDYLFGDVPRMRERVASVRPAWTDGVPGHHAVLAMHAFAFVESGEYERAEETAHAALALHRLDARAHHVMAHVFEMSARADAGLRWLNAQVSRWSVDTVVATHCWWHMALFQLEEQRTADALSLYDGHVRAGHSHEVADLIDAAALLWRVQLRGGDVGLRWTELAAAWAPHIDDAFCSFNDLHAMLAFVGAQDWERAQRLEAVLARSRRQHTRHGETTRQVGLPSCRALMAFGRGHHLEAIARLASLPARAHRFGGSHAQRDVLHLTMLQAVERVRRPTRSTHFSPSTLPALAPT